MRILYVTPRFHPDIGGIENVVFNQSKGLVEKGHSVRVITTTKDSTDLGESEEGGIIVNRCRCFSPGEAYYFSPSIGKLVNHHSESTDIIHAHNYHAFPALHAYVNRNGKPFVLSCHYHRYSHKRFRNLLHRPYRHIARRMVDGADLVACVSVAERQLLNQDFHMKRVVINHNGVEINQVQRGGNSAGPRACAVGRLERYKNVGAAIRALEDIPELGLDIIGMGPDENRLKGLAVKLGVRDRVTFHGFVSPSEKDSIISSSVCLLALSDYESFGITVVEGAMHSVPIIASNIPSHNELAGLLGEGVSIVDPSNIGALSQRIALVMKHGLRTPFSNLEELTWEANHSRLVEAYNTVISTGSRKA